MDVVVRDRDTLAPVGVLGPHPTSGYLAVVDVARLWRPDRVTVELDARVARDVGLVKGMLLVHDGRTFLVEQVHVASDEAGRVSSLATVTGYDPATVPRSIQPSDGQSHHVQADVPGETAMKAYVSASIGEDASSLRRWEPLAIEPDAGRGETGTWRARYQHLSDYLELIGMQTGVGFQTRWNPDVDGQARPEFVAVVGVNRDRRLSIAEGTVRGEELLSTDVDVRNVGYVGGQGEGAARQIVVRHVGADVPAGLLRREAFIDARDTDSTATLQSRGDAKLAETAAADLADLDLQEFDGWRYGVDFGLGDTMSYANDFGWDRLVRLVEVTSTWRESLVPDRTVTLDRPWPDVSERASGGTQYE